MNAPHSLSGGQVVAVAALLGAIACAGCSSPGDVRTEPGARKAHAESSPVEAHTDAAAPSTNAIAAPVRKPSKAEADLHNGIRSYEDAEYEAAARKLRSALDRGLQTPEDRATAYKYLAFVACTSGRVKSCQAEFRKALRVDPTFELGPAEAGHPIWGPVFRKAKLEVNGKGKRRQPDTDPASYASR